MARDLGKAESLSGHDPMPIVGVFFSMFVAMCVACVGAVVASCEMLMIP